jgi:hypothetical protein
MKQQADNLWVVAADFTLLGAELGNHMTVVRLADGRLWLHSPVRYSEELARKLASLGEVGYLVTPCRFHGLFINDWLAAYPGAEFYAVDGVREKAASAPILLQDQQLQHWQPELECLLVAGIPALNECVFFHAASRTLILTDLCFNVGTQLGLWSRIFFRLNGCYRSFTPSRLLKSAIKDKAALRASIDTMLQWDFDRIILAHGEVVPNGGKPLLKKAFAFL